MEKRRAFKRRAILYVPGSSEKMLQKSRTLAVDGVVYDLEDSVAPDLKNSARRMVADLIKQALPEMNGAKKEIIVRVNPFDSPHVLDDLAAVCACPPHAIILPKATAPTVIAADAVLGALEAKHGLPPAGIELIPLIETAMGLETAFDIARASARITALQFGGEDFTREMETRRTAESGEIRYARNRLAVAARACRVDCLDTPYPDFKDVEGYRRDTEYAKSIGMTGRCLIHPSLIEETVRIFTPSCEDIAHAKKVVAAFAAAEREGKGAVALDGKMIDLPIVERARAVLKKSGIESGGES